MRRDEGCPPEGYIPPTCPRCGGTVRVDWADAAAWSTGPAEWIVWETACLTPGCVDEQGGRRVLLP